MTDEKKPVALGVTSPPPASGVGERGAKVILEGLLGPMLADPDLLRRWVLIFRRGPLLSELGAGLEVFHGAVLSGDGGKTVSGSFGVGGVFTIEGAGIDVSVGGVRGRAVSSLGGGRERLSEAAILAAAGGSMMADLRPALASMARIGETLRSLLSRS